MADNRYNRPLWPVFFDLRTYAIFALIATLNANGIGQRMFDTLQFVVVMREIQVTSPLDHVRYTLEPLAKLRRRELDTICLSFPYLDNKLN